MSILLKGMNMPKENSTINVLIYGDGTVFTGSVKDTDFSAVQVEPVSEAQRANQNVQM